MKQFLSQLIFLSFFSNQLFRLIGFSFLMFFSMQSFAQMGIDFDGSGDHVETGGGAEPDYVTVEAWVKPTTLGDYEGIATNWEWTGSNRSGYALYVFADGSIHGWVGFGSTSESVSGGSLPTGSWSHVAMTFDGVDIRLFLNGVQVAANPVSNPGAINYTHTQEGFHIGNAKDSNANYYFDGMIDEVRVWDHARAVSAIADDIHKELCGDETGLVGYYQMNCTDKPGEDKTGNADGTLIGNANSLGGKILTTASCETILCNNGSPITLNSQADVDDFSKNYGCDCNQTGDLTISGVNDISNLLRITSITGDLEIRYTDLTNISFDNLTSIGGDLNFNNNASLTSTGDFGNLTSIEGNLRFYRHASLASIGDFGNLTSIGGFLGFEENASLTSIDDFGNLTSIGEQLFIINNNSLSSISALGNLTSIGSFFSITDNSLLTDISGISLDPTTFNFLGLINNPQLTVCNIQSICDYLDDPNNSATIGSNATGCASRTEVEDACALSLLPVELLTFTAQRANENVHLIWQTASEINNEGFEIWHSQTGSDDWELLDFIAGKGNTSEQQSYRFEHTKPGGGVHYYRLKQIDFDGAFEFSKISRVELDDTNAAMFFKPNPGHSGSEISLNLQIEDFETAELRIFDLSGKTILNQKITNSTTTLNINNLADGIYYAELFNGRQRIFEKLLIQN